MPHAPSSTCALVEEELGLVGSRTRQFAPLAGQVIGQVCAGLRLSRREAATPVGAALSEGRGQPLALPANSPVWQGDDSGRADVRSHEE